jgi:membrane-bound serine protease (ClpP class)
LRFRKSHIFDKGALAVQIAKATLVAAIAVVALVISLLAGSAEESGSIALTISIDGAIGPASAGYVKEALASAGQRHAEIVILRLNTPGGLNTSMRRIIADVLASPDPPPAFRTSGGGSPGICGSWC